MLTASLLVVFILAKVIVLDQRDVEWRSLTVLAYFWQDVCAAAVFGACELIARHRRTRQLVFTLYGGLAIYAALNIPVMLVLSTPLTWPMLRATSGTLADSILLYATPQNILFVLATLTSAVALPLVTRLLGRTAAGLIVPAVASLAAAGYVATPHVDTIGLHRNVVIALVRSGLPHVTATAAADTWTTPPFDVPPTDDYSELRGIGQRKNVVLVSLESTAASYLRLYGGSDDITPHLDQLAAQGVVFEHAYATYPESIKGLFSVLCSTYPAFDTTAELYEHVPCRSFATVAADAGYRTALFHSGRFAYLGMDAVVRNRGFHVLEDAGDIGGQRESSFGVDEPSTVRRMLTWIDSLASGERFLLAYMPIAGHHPYEAPGSGPFEDREELGRYKNALHYGDRALGDLIDGIRARGLERDTVWIVFGDHGEALGQHEGNYGHTFFLYEENVHVPFVIAAPGVLQAPRRSRTAVSLVDVAPTIADLLALDTPSGYQGSSVLTAQARMPLFFTDYSLGLVGLRDGRWKFVAELSSGRGKLFDLERDPAEHVNIAEAHSHRVSTYAHILRGWSAAQKGVIYSARSTAAGSSRNARTAGIQTAVTTTAR